MEMKHTMNEHAVKGKGLKMDEHDKGVKFIMSPEDEPP